MKTEQQASWINGAIAIKSPDEAVESWWTVPQTREQFDAEASANQLRMARSRFGRHATSEKNYIEVQ